MVWIGGHDKHAIERTISPRLIGNIELLLSNGCKTACLLLPSPLGCFYYNNNVHYVNNTYKENYDNTRDESEVG